LSVEEKSKLLLAVPVKRLKLIENAAECLSLTVERQAVINAVPNSTSKTDTKLVSVLLNIALLPFDIPCVPAEVAQPERPGRM
jgi:hypothetical protein